MSEDESFVKEMKGTDIGLPSIIGTPSEVKDIVADLEAAGVDELIVPDYSLGEGKQKLATLDTFIRVVAAR